jgi:hypothetical protein
MSKSFFQLGTPLQICIQKMPALLLLLFAFERQQIRLPFELSTVVEYFFSFSCPSLFQFSQQRRQQQYKDQEPCPVSSSSKRRSCLENLPGI